jgi:uncharacterized protein YodC (DUF2158 family)
MTEIKEGVVVQLISGGPKMMVKSVGDHYGTLSVWCEWFDEKNKPQEARFSLTSVKLIDS